MHRLTQWGDFYGLQIYRAFVQGGGLSVRRLPSGCCVGCTPGGTGGEGRRPGGAGKMPLGRFWRTQGGLHHSLAERLQDRAGYYSGGHSAGQMPCPTGKDLSAPVEAKNIEKYGKFLKKVLAI